LIRVVGALTVDTDQCGSSEVSMRDVSDLPAVDLCNPDSTDQIRSGLATRGITVFRGGTGRDDLLRVARSLMTIRPHRDSDADGVTTIAQRPAPIERTSVAGLTDRELWPHTDGTAVDRPPRILMVACIRPAQTGGRSHLVDGQSLYEEIARTVPALLAELSAPHSACFGEGPGRLGAVFQETGQGWVAIRLRFDELAHFSPTLTPYLDALRTLVRHQTIALDLPAGHGYILLNDRWLHGRTRFTGHREMLRIIGDPLPHHELPNGFPTRIAFSSEP
jgi:Taurine catabolism dioxygenase TauD, TfdA family